MANALKTPNIQDKMLMEAKKQQIEVTIFTTNGVRQSAKILGFDNFIILTEVKGQMQMFYKHAVSTIIYPNGFKLTEK